MLTTFKFHHSIQKTMNRSNLFNVYFLVGLKKPTVVNICFFYFNAHQSHAIVRSQYLQYFFSRGEILQCIFTFAYKRGVVRGVKRHRPLEQKWTCTFVLNLSTYRKRVVSMGRKIQMTFI